MEPKHERQSPHLTARRLTLIGTALLLATAAGASAASLRTSVAAPSQATLTEACVQQLIDALQAEGNTPAEAFENLAVSMSNVPPECQEARRNAATTRLAFSRFRPSTFKGTFPAVGFCGDGANEQLNAFDYTTGQFTLFHQPLSADAHLAAATLALNEAFNEMAKPALAARIATNPEGLQNLEITPTFDGSTMSLSYALPAPVFTHSHEALEDLKAKSGGFVAVDNGLFAQPSQDVGDTFPELALLTDQMNALFEEANLDGSLAIVVGDHGLELAYAG